MKAAVYYETGGPEVFRYEDVADPASATIRADEGRGDQHRGRRHAQPRRGDCSRRPHIVGYQCAGPSSRSATESPIVGGQRVATGDDSGSHAELAPSSRHHLADPRRLADMAAAPASRRLRHCRRLPVRVRTAAGGRDRPRPGGRRWRRLAAIQLAKPGGATGPRDRVERGAAGATARRSASPRHRLRERRLGRRGPEVTGGRGADLVVDSVGGPTLAGSFTCLAYRGRCITVGQRGPRSTPPRRSGLGASNLTHGRVPRRGDHDAAGAHDDRAATSTTSRPAACTWTSTAPPPRGGRRRARLPREPSGRRARRADSVGAPHARAAVRRVTARRGHRRERRRVCDRLGVPRHRVLLDRRARHRPSLRARLDALACESSRSTTPRSATSRCRERVACGADGSRWAASSRRAFPTARKASTSVPSSRPMPAPRARGRAAPRREPVPPPARRAPPARCSSTSRR